MSKFDDLKEFLNIAKDSGARKLEYEMKDKKFLVSFENEGAVVVPSMPTMAHMNGARCGFCYSRSTG